MTRTLQVEADLMNGPIDSTASHHRTLRAARLIRRRALDVIDDERVARRARRLQLETELLLNGSEDGWSRIGGRRDARRSTRGHQVVIERHAIAAGESGLVHDEATSRNAQRIRESGNRSDRCSPPSSREQVPAASKAAVWFQGANVCAR